jgi:Ni/Co efflux regulator RcnB
MNNNEIAPFEKLAYNLVRNRRPRDPHKFSKRSERKAQKEIKSSKKNWLPGEPVITSKAGY